MGRSPAGVTGQAVVGATLGGETDVGKAAVKRRKSVAKGAGQVPRYFAVVIHMSCSKVVHPETRRFEISDLGRFFSAVKAILSDNLIAPTALQIAFLSLKR